MAVNFKPLSTELVELLRTGGAKDAYGNLPETSISDGEGNPCRHCLKYIEEGKGMLILAHRPFATIQPYAETGPIFLCQQSCEPYDEQNNRPEIFEAKSHYIIRGYDNNERIKYGTGMVVSGADMLAKAESILAQPDVASVHIRSSTNNCFQAKIVLA